MRIILASKSPRRRELLTYVTNDFEVISSEVEEIIDDTLTLEDQSANLAYIKAKAVFDLTNENRIVIGSDTMVVKDGVIYGKPKTKEDAKQMLKALTKGNVKHSVITGLCILISKNGKIKEYKFCDTVFVYLKEMTDEEIDKWINTGKAMDKAGAYGIQDEFSVFVNKIEGNYNSVVGLPVHIVYDTIKEYLEK